MCVCVQAIIGFLVLLSLSSAPGIIVWLFILRHDHSIGDSLTTTLWAGYGLIGLTGVVGYVNMTPLFLTLHAATTAVTGAAMVVSYTMVYYSAEARCSAIQFGFRGCNDCPCAVEDSCDAVRSAMAHWSLMPCGCQQTQGCHTTIASTNQGNT